MIDQLRSESLKIRSLRSTWLIAGTALVLSAVIGFAQVRIAAGHSKVTVAQLALAPVQALWFLVVVSAVVLSAGEFQHGTIRTTLLLTPHRSEVLQAKSIASAVFGAITVTAGMVVAGASGLVVCAAGGTHISAGNALDVYHVLAAAGLGALWSVLATALGLLTRSTAIAITAVLLWRFVGEGLLPVLFSPHGAQVIRWTPSGAGNALIGGSGLPVGLATVVIAAFVAVMCAAAAIRLTQQDPA